MPDGAVQLPPPGPDLRARIRLHYGSLSKFAARSGIHKSTLGRVLSGHYEGDAARYEQMILRQLRVDGVSADLGDLPALADLGLTAIVARLDALLGTARLTRRASSEAPVQHALDLIASELASLRSQVGGRAGGASDG